jgi:uncharacterized membrane protein YhhN
VQSTQKKSLAERLNFVIGVSALLAIASVYAGFYAFFVVLKPLTTLLVIGLLYVGVTHWSPFSWWLLSGLVFCLIGDTFLLKDSFFIYGLSAFFVAHVCFLVAFVRHDGLAFSLPVLLLLSGISVSYFMVLMPHLGPMVTAVGLYFLIILLMTIKGVSLAIRRPDAVGHRRVAIAVVLFMLSDSVIGYNKFIASFELSSALILSTYWLSIALIANAGIAISGAKLGD